jgi:hypothetical protein
MTAHNITDRGLAYNAASYERGVSDGNLPIVVDGQVFISCEIYMPSWKFSGSTTSEIHRCL